MRKTSSRPYKPEPGQPKPDLIRYPERRRRMEGQEAEAWERGGHAASDPGLREVYADVRRAPIRLASCPLNKDVNHGGLLRLAEAFRLERVEISPETDGAVDGSAHRGARFTQPHRWVPIERALADARADGYRTVAVTLREGAVALERLEWQFPLMLVVGSELDGVPDEVAAACDDAVAIPLYGMITSLNVATAAAIVVNAAVGAYARQDPSFQPVRNASRRLLELEPADYRTED